jgi:hypothetical protein
MSAPSIRPEDTRPTGDIGPDSARHLPLPDGELLLFDADPQEEDRSATYVLDVLGVIVSVYVRPTGTTVVHLHTVAAASQPLGSSIACEVDDGWTYHIDRTTDNDHDPDPAETNQTPHGETNLTVHDLNVGDRIVDMDARTDMHAAIVESIDTVKGIVNVRTAMGTVLAMNSGDHEPSYRPS